MYSYIRTEAQDSSIRTFFLEIYTLDVQYQNFSHIRRTLDVRISKNVESKCLGRIREQHSILTRKKTNDEMGFNFCFSQHSSLPLLDFRTRLLVTSVSHLSPSLSPLFSISHALVHLAFCGLEQKEKERKKWTIGSVATVQHIQKVACTAKLNRLSLVFSKTSVEPRDTRRRPPGQTLRPPTECVCCR